MKNSRCPCGVGIPRQFQAGNGLNMKQSGNHICALRLEKWPGWPFFKVPLSNLSPEFNRNSDPGPAGQWTHALVAVRAAGRSLPPAGSATPPLPATAQRVMTQGRSRIVEPSSRLPPPLRVLVAARQERLPQCLFAVGRSARLHDPAQNPVQQAAQQILAGVA